jgi:hypothetical protein
MDPAFSIHEPSRDSTILAYGTAGNYRQKLFWIGGGVLGALLLCGWALFLSFSRPLSIPSNTVFLASLSPATAAHVLSSDVVSQLPPLWRAALAGSSHLPVILGAYREGNTWHTFAVVPRWRTKSVGLGTSIIQKQFLVALVTDQQLPPSQKPLRYTDQWSWRKSHFFAPVAFMADPRFLLTDEEQGANAIDLEPFTGTLGASAITTSIPFQRNEHALPLKNADISLNLPASEEFGVLAAAVMNELHAQGFPLSRLVPRPAQINLSYSEDPLPMAADLVYPEPLTKQEIKDLLAGFGITNRRPMQLADGTLATELTAADENGEYKTIQIKDSELRTGDIRPLLPAQNTSCPPNTELWARFSSRALNRLLQAFDLNLQASPTVYLGSRKGSLVVCLERLL